MLVARHYFIRGRVQAVGFRFFLRDAASREGVHGWVRNAADGGVEALVEGDAEAVDRVELALRRGPPAARVDEVTVDERTPTARPIGFSIRS